MRLGQTRSLRQSGIFRTLGRRKRSIRLSHAQLHYSLPRPPTLYWKTGRDFGLMLGIPFRLLMMQIQTADGVVKQLFLIIIIWSISYKNVFNQNRLVSLLIEVLFKIQFNLSAALKKLNLITRVACHGGVKLLNRLTLEWIVRTGKWLTINHAVIIQTVVVHS